MTTKVVVVAKVAEPAAWEAKYRSHAELFKNNNLRNIHYSVNDAGEIATYVESDDVDATLKFIRSDEIARVMAADGVIRDTVRVFVVDKELQL
jgi:hypothetical protein